MQRRLTILLTALIVLCPLMAATQDDPDARAPRLSGFAVYPTTTDTCNPVRLSFTITNTGAQPMLSQNPYTAFVYPLYGSFSAMGLRTLPDRYMIGVSIDGGRDGYPFRWGFPGQLAAGGSTSITGFIAIPEVGSFTFTPVLLKGDQVAARLKDGGATAVVHFCRPTPPPARRFNPPPRVFAPPQFYPPPVIPPSSIYPEPPLIYQAPPPFGGYPVIGGLGGSSYGMGNYPAFIPYNFNGQLLVSAVPFVYTLGAELTFIDGRIIIHKPGVDLILFSGSRYAILNGVPIYLPSPSRVYGGVPYIPPQFVSPILGAMVWVDPLTGIVYINGPRW